MLINKLNKTNSQLKNWKKVQKYEFVI